MAHYRHPMTFPSFVRVVFLLCPLAVVAPAQAAFTDNLDGTVSDTATGLMWDKCSWGQSGASCSGTANTYTWSAALGIAVSANGANYKSHTDWRLPNIKEMESLTDLTVGNPAMVFLSVSNPVINTSIFPNTQARFYWSSTTYTPNSTNAWVVSFFDGVAYSSSKSDNIYVRLVRSGQLLGSFDRLSAASVKSSQTVSFGAAPTLSAGGAAPVSATATSGLAVSFSSLTPTVCSVSGSTVTAISAGACTIAADQAGNAGFNAAAQVTQSITVGSSSVVSRSDCLFNWAEKAYAQFFSPAGALSQTNAPPYFYRYYSGTGNYLGISSADNKVYVLGPSWGNKLQQVGLVTSFLPLSGCP